MTRGASALRERVLCQKKGLALDDLGNPVPGGAVWATQFSVRAGFRPRNGGETALAGRLQGVQPYIVTIRSTENTRQITPEWQLVDARDAKRVFAVRSLSDPDGKRQWLELLVEQGSAG